MNVSAVGLAVVSMFQAKRDVRHYLTTIHLRPGDNGGVHMAATDGHQLAVYFDKDGQLDEPCNVQLNAGMISALRKPYKVAINDMAKGLPREGRVISNGDFLVLKHGEKSVFIQDEWEGDKGYTYQFPLIGNVIPDRNDMTNGMHGVVSLPLVDRILKAAALLTKIHPEGWGKLYAAGVHHCTRGTNGKGCVVSYMTRIPEFMIVTMPMHEDADNPSQMDAVTKFWKSQPKLTKPTPAAEGGAA